MVHHVKACDLVRIYKLCVPNYYDRSHETERKLKDSDADALLHQHLICLSLCVFANTRR